MNTLKSGCPNPQKKRENFLNLNGEWDFSFDRPVYDRKICVPFSWSSPLSGIAEDRKGEGFYRKSVKFDFNDRVFIVIGGADYECEVLINGKSVITHKGAYSSFEAELTPFWVKGEENTIEVRAKDLSEKCQTYGKQGYGDIRGIWKSVYLEERGNVYIKSFKTRTNLSGEVTISTCLSENAENFKLKGEFGGMVFESDTNVLNFKIESPVLWDTENPYLYFGKITAEGENFKDTVGTYFAVREISCEKINGVNRICLNKKPVYINSVLDQGFNADGHFTLKSDEDCEKEILMMKNIGLNGVRFHIKTEEELKYYYADKHGLLVIQDIPCFWGEPEEETKKQFEKELEEIMEDLYNHPSVVYWVIFNETWGLKNFKRDGNGKIDEKNWEYTEDTAKWVEKCFYKAKEIDKTRLIEDNSPCNSDHLVTDVNTWHFYINGYEPLKKHIKGADDKSYEGSEWNFKKGYRQGDVPLMNSECGNFWGIEGGAGDSDISYQLKYMLNEFRLNNKVCGFVFTEFKDVINEFNGIYRIGGDMKENGYSFFAEGMDYKDLFSQDFAAIDCPPAREVGSFEKISLPVYISSFDERYKDATKKIGFRLVHINAGGEKSVCLSKEVEISYGAGLTKVLEIPFEIPDKNGIFAAVVELMCNNETVMRNFCLFDNVIGENYTVSPADLKTKGFNLKFTVQDGEKFNGTGAGEAYAVINKKDIKGYEEGKDIYLRFEASSREKYAKDLKLDAEANLDPINFFVDNPLDEKRDRNKNSFFMTDPEKYPSDVEVYADDNMIARFDMEDDPADTRGCLSHMYQKKDTILDEAGSYGYVYTVKIGKEFLKGKSFVLRFKTENSLSLFGRKSGAYPTGIELFTK